MITARGAFVVQVDETADPAAGRLDGRVEHVVSGKSAPFGSAGALLEFIAEALAGARPGSGTPDATPGDGNSRRRAAKRGRR